MTKCLTQSTGFLIMFCKKFGFIWFVHQMKKPLFFLPFLSRLEMYMHFFWLVSWECNSEFNNFLTKWWDHQTSSVILQIFVILNRKVRYWPVEVKRGSWDLRRVVSRIKIYDFNYATINLCGPFFKIKFCYYFY